MGKQHIYKEYDENSCSRSSVLYRVRLGKNQKKKYEIKRQKRKGSNQVKNFALRLPEIRLDTTGRSC